MAMDAVAALRNLRALTTCHCDECWTARRMHEPNSACDYAGEVQVLTDAVERWRAVEERARVVQGGTSETMAGAADYILGEGAGR
jgi:hypothetical protein